MTPSQKLKHEHNIFFFYINVDDQIELHMDSQLIRRTSTLSADGFTTLLSCFFLEGRITKLGVSSLGACAAFSAALLEEI